MGFLLEIDITAEHPIMADLYALPWLGFLCVSYHSSQRENKHTKIYLKRMKEWKRELVTLHIMLCSFHSGDAANFVTAIISQISITYGGVVIFLLSVSSATHMSNFHNKPILNWFLFQFWDMFLFEPWSNFSFALRRNKQNQNQPTKQKKTKPKNCQIYFQLRQ